MITINIIKVNEVEYLNGKIGKEAYSIENTPGTKTALLDFAKQYNECTTLADANKVLEAAKAFVDSISSTATNSLAEVLKGDLMYNPKTNSYHIISDGKTSVEPVHKFFSEKMIEANDKGLSPKPWLTFWVRLMRNPLYVNDKRKVKTLIKYLNAKYVDEEGLEKLKEDGYSQDVASQLSTFDQISITEEGILAAFKYVDIIDKKYVVKKGENGEQTIEHVDMYERTLEVDPITGEVTKDELALPEFAEDFYFEPPIMRKGGNAFTCKDLDDTNAEPAKGHVIKIGKVHELTAGFSQVNTNDDTSCVPGLHLGGHYYVKGYAGKTNYLVDCLVAPEDIGAVCDVDRGDDGAIRCRRYMVTGAHFQVSRGMYHPSNYAKMLDSEWADAKAEVIANLNKQIADVNAKL